MQNDDYDVIVIGGGISGLLSSLALSKHGNRVLVLEKDDIVGGNCRSYSVDGFTVDTGPHAITALRGGPLPMLMDQYFDTVPSFCPYGNYYIRSQDAQLVRCPTNVRDFLTFDYLPVADRMRLAKTIGSVMLKISRGIDYSGVSVYDCLPDGLKPETLAFADTFSLFMSGCSMKETSVQRMAAGAGVAKEKDMLTTEEYLAIVNGGDHDDEHGGDHDGDHGDYDNNRGDYDNNRNDHDNNRGDSAARAEKKKQTDESADPNESADPDEHADHDKKSKTKKKSDSWRKRNADRKTPENSESFLKAIRKTMTHKGGFSTQGYPIGGIQAITDCAIKSMPSSVDILTGARAQTILTDGGKDGSGDVKAIGVETADKEYYADLVIHTGFASALPNMLELPVSYVDMLKGIKHTVSLSVWIGLDEKRPEFDYIGSEVQFEEMPYWGGSISNYDSSLAPDGCQTAGFAFIPRQQDAKAKIGDAYNELFTLLPDIEKHVVMRHDQITVPEKAAITVSGEFADIRTPIRNLYVAGTDTDKRSMGVTRAAYSVVELLGKLQADGCLKRQNDFKGHNFSRPYLPPIKS
ncbi:MAG: FAD-dependent oxidoreductase [Methanimicrococcus sp.]|nr:FAD-dependent oxidoreductase [Methanimicrococcus sp.]